MPNVRFAACLLAALTLSASALADTKTFVVHGSDGYGFDRCLAAGERCGALAANVLCRSRQYAEAIKFGRVTDVTEAASDASSITACKGRDCLEAVAITCTR